MVSTISAIELGKKDAENFISQELIEYEPFVALSDMHLVHKTIPVNYQALKDTITKLDNELWLQIEQSATELAQKHGDLFSLDLYADGFTQGVAAVWDKIRDNILK